jgi:hypothetical protein
MSPPTLLSAVMVGDVADIASRTRIGDSGETGWWCVQASSGDISPLDRLTPLQPPAGPVSGSMLHERTCTHVSNSVSRSSKTLGPG